MLSVRSLLRYSLGTLDGKSSVFTVPFERAVKTLFANNKMCGIFYCAQDVHLYKKAMDDMTGDECVVEMVVPAGARMVKPFDSNKVRAECCEVNSIVSLKSDIDDNNIRVRSIYDPATTYQEGDIVVPSELFDTSIEKECASGIHCFGSVKEAAKYEFDEDLFEENENMLYREEYEEERFYYAS